MSKKTWIVLLLIIPYYWANAFVIASDVLQGAYWPEFPIRMQVVVPPNDGGLLWNTVKECEQEWEDALGINIWDIVAATSGDRNTIYWEDNFGQETGYNPNQTLALTLRFQQNGLFDRVQIVLNGSMSLLRQNWSNLLKKTLLHEMGHTIGLDHSTDPAIMQAYIGQYGQLENDDIQGGSTVIDEQKHRQAVGYIAPLSMDDKKVISCGTIEYDGEGGSPAALSFIFSMAVGMCLIVGGKSFMTRLCITR